MITETIPDAAASLFAAIDRFNEMAAEPEPPCIKCAAGEQCNWHPNKTIEESA